MKKKPVGRPRKLNRQNVINIAYNQYWLHGIENVPLSNIAKVANISRPGIYVEFGDEDALQAEVIKKYTYALEEHILAQYKDSKDIKTLLFHFNSYIGFPDEDKKIFLGVRNASIFNTPKAVNGCLYEKAKIVKHLLKKKTVNEINNYEQHRKNEFKKYINKMQKNGKIKQTLKSEDVYEYIAATLLMIQTLKNNGMNKLKIREIVDKALSAILSPISLIQTLKLQNNSNSKITSVINIA